MPNLPPSVKTTALDLLNKAKFLKDKAWALGMDDLVKELDEIEKIRERVNKEIKSKEFTAFNKALDEVVDEIKVLMRRIKFKDDKNKEFIKGVTNVSKYLTAAANVLLAAPPIIFTIMYNS